MQTELKPSELLRTLAAIAGACGIVTFMAVIATLCAASYCGATGPWLGLVFAIGVLLLTACAKSYEYFKSQSVVASDYEYLAARQLTYPVPTHTEPTVCDYDMAADVLTKSPFMA